MLALEKMEHRSLNLSILSLNVITCVRYKGWCQRAIKIVKDFAFKSPDDTKINELSYIMLTYFTVLFWISSYNGCSLILIIQLSAKADEVDTIISIQ